MEPQGKVQKAPIDLIYDGFQGLEGLVAAVAATVTAGHNCVAAGSIYYRQRPGEGNRQTGQG